jgi:hypothetical protein
MEFATLIENEYPVFLGFLKAKYPMFHNSNFFFRDLQYGVEKFMEKKGIKIRMGQAEKVARALASYLEEKGIFVRINNFSWRVNYPEYVTTTPGDPF